MNFNRKLKRTIVCLVMGTSLTYAQEPREISLSEAISYALENKAAAEKARLEITDADAKIEEVRSNALPQITGSGSTTFNPLLQESLLPGEILGMPGEDIAVAFGAKWNSTGTVQLTQTLFNQAVFTGLKAAKSTKEFYQLNAQLTTEEIIETVATAYYQVYQSEQVLGNLESNLALTEQTIKVVEGLVENGLAKKIDLTRAKVAVNNLLANKQQALNAVELSENTLKFMMGMSIAAEIGLPEQSFQPILLPGADLEMAERTELQLQQKRIELLNWQKKATLAEYYPTASLSANYGWLGQGDAVSLWNGKEKGVFWSDLAGIGINIEIPVFNGFGTRSRVKQDQIEIQKAQADLQENKLSLQLAYKNAVAQLENSLLTIHIQEKNVALAQQVFEDIRNNFELGLATLNDVLDAERDLAEAKNNLTNARLDYKLAEVELLKSHGKLETLNEKL